MRILITSGGTREPIDSVRCITNFSTGATGALLAEEFVSDGCNVDYVHGTHARLPQVSAETEGSVGMYHVTDVASLKARLLSLLKTNTYDAVVHAMAVSDYKVKHISVDDKLAETGGKIPSGHKLYLEFEPTEKIIALLRPLAGKDTVIVGFKLMSADTSYDELSDTSLAMLEKYDIDFVFGNTAADLSFNGHAGFLFTGDGCISEAAGKSEIAEIIAAVVADKITERQSGL